MREERRGEERRGEERREEERREERERERERDERSLLIETWLTLKSPTGGPAVSIYAALLAVMRISL